MSTTFYQLTPSDLKELCQILKGAQLKVLLWLRATNPFGKFETELDLGAIAQALSISKASVSRSLQRLAELRLINLSVERRVKAKPVTPMQQPKHQTVAPMQQEGPKRCTHATDVAPMQHEEAESQEPQATQPTERTYRSEKKNVTSLVREVNWTDKGLQQALEVFPERKADALKCLEQQTGEVQNPTGFLITALRRGWKPKETQRSFPDFGAWFNAARAKGEAIASQLIGEDIYVLRPGDRWEKWQLDNDHAF